MEKKNKKKRKKLKKKKEKMKENRRNEVKVMLWHFIYFDNY